MIYRQFETTLGEISNFYQKQKVLRDLDITQEEIDNFVRLYNLFKSKKLTEGDLFSFKHGVEHLPIEVREQLKKIDEINPFEFKDGIDTESHDYVYLNAFNQFRYENEHIINMNVNMMQK